MKLQHRIWLVTLTIVMTIMAGDFFIGRHQRDLALRAAEHSPRWPA
jgi:hypothetical protein